MQSPSQDGIRRYPAAVGYYQLHQTDFNKYPCNCLPRCAEPCDGQCGCYACRTAHVDRISGETFARRARACKDS